MEWEFYLPTFLPRSLVGMGCFVYLPCHVAVTAVYCFSRNGIRVSTVKESSSNRM